MTNDTPNDHENFFERMRDIIRSEIKQFLGRPVEYQVAGLTQKPLYKADEVCSILDISRQTLHTWVKEGILQQYKIKSRSFYRWSDIEKLLSKSTEKVVEQQ
jgi:predicted DNA-binding transcriptional regulator AlpA